jgi:hypothetical protein
MIKDRDFRMIERISLVAQVLSDVGDPKVGTKIRSRAVLAGMGDILWEVYGYLTKRLETLQISGEEFAAEKVEPAAIKSPVRTAKAEDTEDVEHFEDNASVGLVNYSEEKSARAEGGKKGLWDE